jgi:hypothetical protein
MNPNWQDYVSPSTDLNWKEITMKLLQCAGHFNDDWYEQYWHKFGITRPEGKKIVEEYEKYQDNL